ncbi:MAG: hypothetical protein K8S20_05075 [Chloroflexi bacterium]|nr:hypothetical protein [Chloroflexota bacterium]
MKTKVAILVFISILLVSCAPATPTQEDKIVEIATTEEIVTEAPTTQEPITTEEPIVTEEATKTPIACVTLLTPTDGSEIPPVGKVTFSWTPMNEVGKYVLNIILPSGEIVPFETDETFYDRYMEAFVAGGEYQWQVVAKDTNGSEICVSEVSTFDKSAYENPNGGSNGGNDGSGDSGGDSGGCTDPGGCSGGGQ